MTFERQVSRMLDGEHRTNLALLGRLEQAFAHGPRAPAARDGELSRLIAAFGRHLDDELERHFAFEEHELFPRMNEAGDGGIAALLREEHDTIRDVAGELRPLVHAACDGTLDDAGWVALRSGALELVERQVAHIQKETMALLPLLDDLLDEDADGALALAYAAA